MANKIDVFFELLRAIYGASRYEAQWPDKTHEDAAKKLWHDLISRHTEEELRGALDHAQKMASNGEKEWQWPNIGLILSGARRIGIPSHRLLLSGRERTPEEKEAMREDARCRARALRAMFE